MSASHHLVDLPSGRIAVHYETGVRAPVLMLHGNSAHKEVFANQVAMLRQNGFGVLTLDLPGHGQSDNAKHPALTYSFPGYAAAVAQVLDSFTIDTVHVAGWSLGGHIGLELMGRDPRVQSLLIWGTPPIKPGLEAMRDAFLPSESMAFAGQLVLGADECARYGAAMVGARDGAPPDLVAAIQRTDGAARAQMMANGLGGVGRNAQDLVERDPRPLAVLHGAEDPFVSLAYLANLAYRNLWRGQVQVLPGIGHAAHWQDPKIFNALLLSFLLSASEKVSL
ncbi:alpha/beta fold hydrolase [Beijerinckia sp. L45]|uniref:alpha/beta fold hydrolase n=1 Tax=Beijerinckia sp. L45 TaxID=1641855 RepID=UPI00131E0A7A|nr:alpha/beta hydrolase [Beijerinckia sp. L45]